MTLLPGTFVRLTAGDLAGTTGTVVRSDGDRTLVQRSATAETIWVKTTMLEPSAGQRATWTQREAEVAA